MPTEKPHADTEKQLSAFVSSEVSGRGVDTNIPRQVEIYAMQRAAMAGLEIGNAIGCDLAASMSEHKTAAGPMLSETFTTGSKKARQAVVAVLALHMAVINGQIREAAYVIKDETMPLEARFMAFNAAVNIIIPLVATAHAVKDMSDMPTPSFILDAVAEHTKTIGEWGELLVKARDKEPAPVRH